jgi:pilus assembly protein CpaE
MSDQDPKSTAVLLPTSSVAIYSNEKASLEAIQNLQKDWRFARVKIDAHEGTLKNAIETYQNYASPDLLIVQTDKIDDEFTGQLETLAGYCDENTAAIVVGPVNDVQLYRRLIQMGVSDYLVRPLETSIMADVIAKTLINRIGVTGSNLITFIGAKGGMGVTALAQAAAWGAADILKQKTILLDSAGGWSPLSVGMGFEPSTTLLEAAKAAEKNDEDSLSRMIFEASDKLSVLATGGDMMLEHSITPAQLEILIDALMARYPLVIADISYASHDLARTVVARSNQILLVSTPHLAALRLARSLLLEMKDMRGGKTDNIDLVINMQGLSAKNEVPVKDIEAAMEFKVKALLPFAPDVFITAESASQKITQNTQGQAMVREKILPLFSKSLPQPEESGDVAEKASAGIFSGFFSKTKNA